MDFSKSENAFGLKGVCFDCYGTSFSKLDARVYYNVQSVVHLFSGIKKRIEQFYSSFS